jgi:hypothetical protein
MLEVIMVRFFATLFCLLFSFASGALADEILCPSQKEPACQDILPAKPEKCERNFCNVAKSTPPDGRTSCLWTCAAHFQGFTLNGVGVDSLFDAFKKSQKQ